MQRVLWIISVFILASTGIALAGETLVIAGTGDSQVLLRKVAAVYEKLHKGVKIKVPESIGSGGGVKALLRGEAGLARTARLLKTKEKPGLTQVLFAHSPIVFAAHPSVEQVPGVTEAQILGIYSGSIVNWLNLGGPDAKIYPLGREEGDSSRKVLDKTLPGFKNIKAKTKVKVAYSTPEMTSLIRGNKFTIGYLPLSMAKTNDLHVLSLAKQNPLLLEEKYPHLTPFYLIHTENPTVLTQKFLDFVASDAAAAVMIAEGVIPQKYQ